MNPERDSPVAIAAERARTGSDLDEGWRKAMNIVAQLHALEKAHKRMAKRERENKNLLRGIVQTIELRAAEGRMLTIEDVQAATGARLDRFRLRT